MEKSAKKTASKKAGAAKGSQQGFSSEENQSMLMEFFIDSLRDMYWAEKHLVKALGKLQKAATSEQLATAFADHMAVTEEQVARLEQVFEMLGEKARGKKCEAMEGLVKEAETIIEETEDGSSTRDVGLIIAAQKVEHYEIACYGSLVTLARTLGQNKIAEILTPTLNEEKETDAILTEIAEGSINHEASQETVEAS